MILLDTFIKYYNQSKNVWGKNFDREFDISYVSGLQVLELYIIGTQYSVGKPEFNESKKIFSFPIYELDECIGSIELSKQFPVLTLYRNNIIHNHIVAFGNNITGQLCDVIDGKKILTFITNEGIKQGDVDYYYNDEDGLGKMADIIKLHEEFIKESSNKLTK